MSKPNVVLFDYGSGNLHSAERALARAGADVSVTFDLDAAREADGLVVPGVGAHIGEDFFYIQDVSGAVVFVFDVRLGMC